MSNKLCNTIQSSQLYGLIKFLELSALILINLYRLERSCWELVMTSTCLSPFSYVKASAPGKVANACVCNVHRSCGPRIQVDNDKISASQFALYSYEYYLLYRGEPGTELTLVLSDDMNIFTSDSQHICLESTMSGETVSGK